MRKASKALGFVLIVLLAVSGCGTASPDTHKRLPVETAVYTFSDGERVSTWKFENDRKLLYLLSDDTELMATDLVGPAHFIVEGVEPLENLEQNVQDSIIEFYERQGALYDIEEYLEKAYAAYTAQEEFRSYYLRQESFVSASNEKIVFCTTSVGLPLGGDEYDSYCITRAFDKESGSLINGWDLFSGSEEEIKSALMSGYSANSEILTALYAAFKPEYVRFYPDEYSIIFPAAVSSGIGQKDDAPAHNIEINGSYTDEVLSVLNPWVQPD